MNLHKINSFLSLFQAFVSSTPSSSFAMLFPHVFCRMVLSLLKLPLLYSFFHSSIYSYVSPTPLSFAIFLFIFVFFGSSSSFHSCAFTFPLALFLCRTVSRHIGRSMYMSESKLSVFSSEVGIRVCVEILLFHCPRNSNGKNISIFLCVLFLLLQTISRGCSRSIKEDGQVKRTNSRKGMSKEELQPPSRKFCFWSVANNLYAWKSSTNIHRCQPTFAEFLILFSTRSRYSESFHFGLFFLPFPLSLNRSAFLNRFHPQYSFIENTLPSFYEK